MGFCEYCPFCKKMYDLDRNDYKCPDCKKKYKEEKSMNRIRYTKNGNRLESVKTFNHLTNGARYKVVLEESSGTWFVLDAEGGTVAAKGQETSLHKVKKAAKTALSSLGIEFSKEERGEDVVVETTLDSMEKVGA